MTEGKGDPMTLADLAKRAIDAFNAMSPEEQKAHRQAQRESWVRGMTTPCEHGVLDFEQCGDCRSLTIAIGDRVRKVRGYRWPGVVVADFHTLSGERRLVVECTVPDVAGALHIYNPDQLEKFYAA